MLELAVEAACFFSKIAARVKLRADSSTRHATNILIAQEVIFGFRWKKLKKLGGKGGGSSLAVPGEEGRGRSWSWTCWGLCSFL